MKKHWLKLLFSVFISALILWLLLRLISDESNPITFEAVTGVLRNVSVATFLTFLIIHLAGVVLRTIRFRLLIGATGSEIVPSFWRLFPVTLVRNMTVDLLPARLGELFYVGLLNRGFGVRLDSCFSSLAISIWFDVMVIIPLVLGLVLYPLLDAAVQHRLLVIAGLLVFICVIGILILHPGLGIAARWLQRFPSNNRLWRQAQDFISHFAGSVQRSLNRETIVKTFVLTIGVRICKYSSIVLLFTGVARAGFPELVDADPGAILVALLASEAGASLPVPAFMGFGTYEAGGLAAFAMLGMPLAAAGLALFTIHLATQSVDYLLGAGAFVAFLMLTGLKPSMMQDLEPIKTHRH